MWDPPPVLFLHSEAPTLRIFFAYLAYHAPSETYPIDAQLARLGPTDHVFLFLTWHRLGFDAARLRQYAQFPCEVILCANTPGEFAELQGAGVRSIYFNHNATLDERIFCMQESTVASGTRPFRLVVNAAWEPYKRLHLAAHVQDAAWIGYWQPGAAAPADPPFSAWLNIERGNPSSSSSSSCGSSGHSSYWYLQPAEVAAALNRSMLGGVFSEEEGTCWASTEYLLCGLPVVSTPCSGGREVWCNEGNSLIVEATPEAVAEAVERGIALLNSGVFDRRQIHEGALALVRKFRGTLIQEMQHICDQHGVQIVAARHFTAAFVHKMGLK